MRWTGHRDDRGCPVADVVTHVIAVDQAAEAFDIAKNSVSGKVLVKLDGGRMICIASAHRE